MTSGSAAAQEPASEFTLVTPADWYRIVLEPEERREAAIQRLVDRQFKGVDNQPKARREFLQELSNAADDGRSRGGLEMYLSLGSILDVPLAASLLVCAVDPAEIAGNHVDLDDLAPGLHAQPDTHAAIVDHAVGRAVRKHRTYTPREAKDMGAEGPSTEVTYYLPAPDGQSYLVLCFSTPLEPLAEALVELFDAVAASARWVERS